MHVNPVLSVTMINVIVTPSGLGGPPTSLYGWVDDMQVQMFLLGEYCFEEREFLVYRTCLDQALIQDLVHVVYLLRFYYILSCIWWRLFIMLDLSDV